MTPRNDLSLMLAEQATLPEGLLFRPADDQRLHTCAAAVLAQGMSVALSSASEPALDHCAELLIHRLRRSTRAQVELFFPASTAALVARFEQRVAQMTLQQAMQARVGREPERIWIVQDAGVLAQAEVQLLARLAGGFPGAGVAVVMLCGPAAASRRSFDGLGPHFLRWDIAPPTPGETRQLFERAHQGGWSAAVAPLQALLPSEPVMSSADLVITDLHAMKPAAESDQPGPGRRLWRDAFPVWRSSLGRWLAQARARMPLGPAKPPALAVLPDAGPPHAHGSRLRPRVLASVMLAAAVGGTVFSLALQQVLSTPPAKLSRPAATGLPTAAERTPTSPSPSLPSQSI
jgi:hypothetical protein